MTYNIPKEIREEYFNVLDYAQVIQIAGGACNPSFMQHINVKLSAICELIELLCLSNGCKEVADKLRNTEELAKAMSYELGEDFNLPDDTSSGVKLHESTMQLIRSRIRELNSILDDYYSKCGQATKLRMDGFRVDKKAYRNDYVDVHIPINYIHEDGKLVKEYTCPVCGEVFRSNRQKTRYCSDRCRQAAYRGRKTSTPK